MNFLIVMVRIGIEWYCEKIVIMMIVVRMYGMVKKMLLIWDSSELSYLL